MTVFGNVKLWPEPPFKVRCIDDSGCRVLKKDAEYEVTAVGGGRLTVGDWSYDADGFELVDAEPEQSERRAHLGRILRGDYDEQWADVIRRGKVEAEPEYWSEPRSIPAPQVDLLCVHLNLGGVEWIEDVQGYRLVKWASYYRPITYGPDEMVLVSRPAPEPPVPRQADKLYEALADEFGPCSWSRKYAEIMAAHPALADLDPTTIHVRFDGPPGPTAGRLIETETPDGRGVGVGKWIDRGDGTWALAIQVPGSTVRGLNPARKAES